MVIFPILLWILLVFVTFLLFYKFVFLRDPDRDIPSGNNITAPADGEVIKIMELEKENLPSIKIEKGIIGQIRTLVSDTCKEGYLITIMMNVFNVHVQRSPVEGTILSTKHVSGSFKNAVYGDKFENGLRNEKNEIIIKNKTLGRVKVIQIAGILARRIECFVKKNQKVNKGERIGRINLGSQVSLILPKKIKLFVKEGDRIKAGETIIGEF